MKFKKNNNKERSGKKIQALPMNPEDISQDMKDIMAGWQAKQQIEKNELAAETWPTWLLPEGFKEWYLNEQKNRSDQGNIPLPDPPPEIIFKVFGK